jgi:hypothetical protein
VDRNIGVRIRLIATIDCGSPTIREISLRKFPECAP